jgi:uncharacterized sporulation protein YeaH/YhbH (DUF444 family)
VPRRIKEDHKNFRDVVEGRFRRELKRLVKGKIIRLRSKNGKFQISAPGLDIPHFVYGNNGEGIGRGKGKKGKVIGKDPEEGEGSEAGDEHKDGIVISVDFDEILSIFQEELELPDLKPKSNETYEDIKIVYKDISKVGPESLRHTRRTILEAVKRMAMQNSLDNYHYVPGSNVPIKLISVINSDRRYRQYKEIKVPSSNAVIFFVRDCSGSMDDYRCDIVSDMSWWLESWIRKFYENVERTYVIHDTEAEEVSEDKFYNYREGGGTMISSAFKKIVELIENKYPPHNYNIYIFYFSDGDNWGDDNARTLEIIKKQLPIKDINLIGFSQICTYNYDMSFGHYLESQKDAEDIKPIRLVNIGSDGDSSFSTLSEEDRNRQIIDGIKKILGKN